MLGNQVFSPSDEDKRTHGRGMSTFWTSQIRHTSVGFSWDSFLLFFNSSKIEKTLAVMTFQCLERVARLRKKCFTRKKKKSYRLKDRVFFPELVRGGGGNTKLLKSEKRRNRIFYVFLVQCKTKKKEMEGIASGKNGMGEWLEKRVKWWLSRVGKNAGSPPIGQGPCVRA